jgi:hypothetical protein
MRNVIGFDTPSKAKLQDELNAQSKSSTQMQVIGDLDKLKMETVQRLSQLGDLICNDGFVNYSMIQRQQLLLDFAYYSKVADSIL